MEVVTEVALGKGDVSLAALGKFCGRTYELIDQVWRSDRSNPPERQQAKQDFVDLMRDHTWIVTIACIAYTLFVHFGPALIRRPWPVKGVLAVWNLALAVFSAFGAWHCLSGLLANMAAQGWRYTVCTQPKMIDLAGTDLDAAGVRSPGVREGPGAPFDRPPTGPGVRKGRVPGPQEEWRHGTAPRGARGGRAR